MLSEKGMPLNALVLTWRGRLGGFEDGAGFTNYYEIYFSGQQNS